MTKMLNVITALPAARQRVLDATAAETTAQARVDSLPDKHEKEVDAAALDLKEASAEVARASKAYTSLADQVPELLEADVAVVCGDSRKDEDSVEPREGDVTASAEVAEEAVAETVEPRNENVRLEGVTP